MKIAFLFGGQGTQFVGMGDGFDDYAYTKGIYDKATSKANFDVNQIIKHGPSEKLTQTNYAQVALVAQQLIIVKALQEANIISYATAGLSLGEYTALYDARAFSMSELLDIIVVRGQMMHELALKKTNTQMVVVLGQDEAITNELVTKIYDQGHQIFVSNYNSPFQQVVAGTTKAIALLKNQLAPRIKAFPLKVTIPSHTPLMKSMSKAFAQHLEKFTFQNLTKNFYSNVTGEKTTSKDVKTNLVKQLTSPTYMSKIITNMLHDEVSVFIDIGPKITLGNFVKAIAKKLNKKVEVFNINNKSTLQETIKKIKEMM